MFNFFRVNKTFRAIKIRILVSQNIMPIYYGKNVVYQIHFIKKNIQNLLAVYLLYKENLIYAAKKIYFI